MSTKEQDRAAFDVANVPVWLSLLVLSFGITGAIVQYALTYEAGDQSTRVATSSELTPVSLVAVLPPFALPIVAATILLRAVATIPQWIDTSSQKAAPWLKSVADQLALGLVGFASFYVLLSSFSTDKTWAIVIYLLVIVGLAYFWLWWRCKGRAAWVNSDFGSNNFARNRTEPPVVKEVPKAKKPEGDVVAGLSDVLSALGDELHNAETKVGDHPMVTLGGADVELDVSVNSSADGGIDFWVVNADLSHTHRRTARVTVHLFPNEPDIPMGM